MCRSQLKTLQYLPLTSLEVKAKVLIMVTASPYTICPSPSALHSNTSQVLLFQSHHSSSPLQLSFWTLRSHHSKPTPSSSGPLHEYSSPYMINLSRLLPAPTQIFLINVISKRSLTTFFKRPTSSLPSHPPLPLPSFHFLHGSLYLFKHKGNTPPMEFAALLWSLGFFGLPW